MGADSPRLRKFLQAALGDEALQALEQGLAREPKLAKAMPQRAVLSWALKACQYNYDGPVPGQDDLWLTLSKAGATLVSDQEQVDLGQDLYKIAAALALTLDMEPEHQPLATKAAQRLGKSLDQLVGTRMGRVEAETIVGLRKAISLIPPGKPSGPDQHNYSHVLSPDLQARGYELHVHANPATGALHARALHRGQVVGEVQGSHEGQRLDIQDAEVHDQHRGQGLGLHLYEGLMAHAHHQGATHVEGGVHSSSAGKLHQALARKHGLGYNQTPTPFPHLKSPEPGDYDGHHGPYEYAIKKEPSPLEKGWPRDEDENQANAAAHPVMEDAILEQGGQKLVDPGVTIGGETFPATNIPLPKNLRQKASQNRTWAAAAANRRAGGAPVGAPHSGDLNIPSGPNEIAQIPDNTANMGGWNIGGPGLGEHEKWKAERTRAQDRSFWRDMDTTSHEAAFPIPELTRGKSTFRFQHGYDTSSSTGGAPDEPRRQVMVTMRDAFHEDGERAPHGPVGIWNPHTGAWFLVRARGYADLRAELEPHLRTWFEANPLAKKTGPVFPKLGFGDDRRETEIADNPRQKQMMAQVQAQSIKNLVKDPEQAQHLGVPSGVSPQEVDQYFRERGHDGRGALGSVAIGPNPGPHVIGPKMRRAQYMALKPDLQDHNESLNDPNSVRPVQLHENLHGLFNRIGNKHGGDARNALTQNLWAWVSYRAPKAAHAVQEAMKRFYNFAGQEGKPPFEEFLATTLNLANSKSDRADLNLRLGLDQDQARKLHQAFNTVHRHMGEGGKMADERWLSPHGFTQFLQNHARTAAPEHLSREDQQGKLDFMVGMSPRERARTVQAMAPPKKHFLDDMPVRKAQAPSAESMVTSDALQEQGFTNVDVAQGDTVPMEKPESRVTGGPTVHPHGTWTVVFPHPEGEEDQRYIVNAHGFAQAREAAFTHFRNRHPDLPQDWHLGTSGHSGPPVDHRTGKEVVLSKHPEGHSTLPDGRVFWDLREPHTDDLPINKAEPYDRQQVLDAITDTEPPGHFNPADWESGSLSMDEAKKLAMPEDEKDWDTYHRAYVARGDVPDHGDSVWPIVLGDDGAMLDGWHRLHSYARKGLTQVPFLRPVKSEPLEKGWPRSEDQNQENSQGFVPESPPTEDRLMEQGLSTKTRHGTAVNTFGEARFPESGKPAAHTLQGLTAAGGEKIFDFGDDVGAFQRRTRTVRQVKDLNRETNERQLRAQGLLPADQPHMIEPPNNPMYAMAHGDIYSQNRGANPEEDDTLLAGNGSNYVQGEGLARRRGLLNDHENSFWHLLGRSSDLSSQKGRIANGRATVRVQKIPKDIAAKMDPVKKALTLDDEDHEALGFQRPDQFEVAAHFRGAADRKGAKQSLDFNVQRRGQTPSLAAQREAAALRQRAHRERKQVAATGQPVKPTLGHGRKYADPRLADQKPTTPGERYQKWASSDKGQAALKAKKAADWAKLTPEQKAKKAEALRVWRAKQKAVKKNESSIWEMLRKGWPRDEDENQVNAAVGSVIQDHLLEHGARREEFGPDRDLLWEGLESKDIQGGGRKMLRVGTLGVEPSDEAAMNRHALVDAANHTHEYGFPNRGSLAYGDIGSGPNPTAMGNGLPFYDRSPTTNELHPYSDVYFPEEATDRSAARGQRRDMIEGYTLEPELHEPMEQAIHRADQVLRPPPAPKAEGVPAPNPGAWAKLKAKLGKKVKKVELPGQTHQPEKMVEPQEPEPPQFQPQNGVQLQAQRKKSTQG